MIVGARSLHNNHSFQLHFLRYINADILLRREPVAVLARQPVSSDKLVLLHVPHQTNLCSADKKWWDGTTYTALAVTRWRNG